MTPHSDVSTLSWQDQSIEFVSELRWLYGMGVITLAVYCGPRFVLGHSKWRDARRVLGISTDVATITGEPWQAFERDRRSGLDTSSGSAPPRPSALWHPVRTGSPAEMSQRSGSAVVAGDIGL